MPIGARCHSKSDWLFKVLFS